MVTSFRFKNRKERKLVKYILINNLPMKAQTMCEYNYIYMKTRTDDTRIESMFNELGSQGWELVSVIGGVEDDATSARIHSYIFKRPKL